MLHSSFSRGAVAAVLAAGLFSAAPASALNLFSERQELELGRRAAAQAESQLPMLRDDQVQSYVNGIVRRLAASAPGPRFSYQARVVNAADINAFALPGGFLYVNRGLIDAARTEDELAGVLAHEVAHVALRHPTEQLSKAYGVQAGAGILGQILAGRDGRLGLPEQLIGSLGLNALMMKFSRNAENEADRVGAQIMARAGYDTLGMASFFDVLQQQRGRNPSAVAQFFSSHPSPANRSANIRQIAQTTGRGRTARVGGLRAIQARLDRYPVARRSASLR
jgi:beta-barrel assembly-enhancing protease